MSDAVRDNPQRQRYELAVEGEIAIATYRRDGDLTTFVHTEVPQRMEGRGIGSTLVAGALDLVREAGGRAAAECPFVSEFVAKHPEYQSLFARRQTAPERAKQSDKARQDAKLDEALQESFPTSDPPAITQPH